MVANGWAHDLRWVSNLLDAERSDRVLHGLLSQCQLKSLWFVRCWSLCSPPRLIPDTTKSATLSIDGDQLFEENANRMCLRRPKSHERTGAL